MNQTSYLYSVHPIKAIKTVRDIPIIRSPKSLYLDKEQVTECLKYGIVYRRFNAKETVKVTIANLDRLHNSVFMTKEEYEKFISNGGTVINTEDVVDQEPVVIVTEEEPLVEEKSNETEPVAVVTEEEKPVENTEEAVITTDKVDETVVVNEEKVNSEEAEKTEVPEVLEKKESNKQEYHDNKNYNGKNNRRH